VSATIVYEKQILQSLAEQRLQKTLVGTSHRAPISHVNFAKYSIYT